MKKLIYTAILSALVLQSCSKDGVLNTDIDNAKAIEKSDNTMLSFSAELDATYEYDDDQSRAIQVTADDAPRIHLSEAEFKGPDPDTVSAAGRGDRLELNALRLNWYSYGQSDNSLKSEEHLNLNTWKNRTIKLEKVNGKDVVKVWIKLNDIKSLRKRPGGVWFAQMLVGGFPGKNGKGDQYFSRFREAQGKDKEDIRSHPNSRIDELLPGTGEMGRRHFPLMGDITLMNHNYWAKPGIAGSYENNGSASSTGQIGVNEYMPLKARGTIFTFTLKNKTGKNIEVTDIEVPVREGSSRGAAFSFEGRFQSSRLRPFSGGVLDPAGCVPVFERYNSPHVPDDEATNVFPLYRRGGDRNVPLAIDQTSAGRFMVWAYVHEPNRPFTVRVRYSADGANYYSDFQTVTPPTTGFKEGKAYRSNLIIKGGTAL